MVFIILSIIISNYSIQLFSYLFMKQFSYQDIKLLRQAYKTVLDQLYEAITQQRIDKLTDLLTLIAITSQISYFLQQLNSSGDIQLTASLQILRVKCGMYKQYSIKKLIEIIDVLLYQFSKQLKNYTRKVKQIKLEINPIDFYGKTICNQQHFLIYVIYLKIILPKYESDIRNQSKIQQLWAILISNLINTLKKQNEQKIVYKSVILLSHICSQNVIFKKEVVKNGILPYLIDFIEESKIKWLIAECLKLIQILTEEKQIAKLLIQQNSQPIFIKILKNFKNEDISKRITNIMDNQIKFVENQYLSNILKQARDSIKNSKKQNEEETTKSLQKLKLYSKSTNFIKFSSQSPIHKQLIPLLQDQNTNQKIQLLTLDIFQSILENKQQYKQSNEAFQLLSKPLIQNIKNQKDFQKLNQYLKILMLGLKKDFINKQYIKKNNVSELIQKIKSRQQVHLQKFANQIMTIIELKDGKVKTIQLDANRKSKDIKQLEKVHHYLDSITNFNLYDQVKKQNLQALSEFLDLFQNEYPSQNEEEVQATIINLKTKILQIITHLFTSKVIVSKLATQKLLNNLINSLQASTLVKQTFEIIEIIISSCDLTYNKQKTLQIFQILLKKTPLNEQTTNSCGQILYYINSIEIAKQLIANFNLQYKNIQYLAKLTTCLSTIPDDIDQNDIKLASNILNTLDNQNFDEAGDEIIQNWILILIRLSKISNLYKQKIRNHKQLLKKIQNKFQIANLNLYVLELFTNLIESQVIIINRISFQVVNSLVPSEEIFKSLLSKVIENNKYTNSQVKFVEKMIKYEQKMIVDKVKIKNSQLIYQVGQLFALILQNNPIQSKKLPLVMQDLQKQIQLNHKNLNQVLIFFESLKYRENAPSAQNLIQILKIYSTYSISKYELYPQYYQLLNLVLRVLERVLQKKDQRFSDLEGINKLLQDLFKIFYVQKKSEEIYPYDQIFGSDEKKEHTIQNIYKCLHALSKIYQFKFKQNDLLIKYAQNSTNAYIMYKVAGIIQNCNFNELKFIKIKLKSCLNRYPKVKHLISFDEKYKQNYYQKKVQSQKQEKLASENLPVPSPQKIQQFTQNKINSQINEETYEEQYQNLPSEDIRNQNQNKQLNQKKKYKATKMKLKKQVISNQVILRQLTSLVEIGVTNLPIPKLIDSIQEKSPIISSLLIKLFLKQNQEQLKKPQIRNRILKKISEQNLQPSEDLFLMFQKYPQTLRLTEKIKIKGEKAFDFGIKILKNHPAFGCKIIEYNLQNQKDFQIFQASKMVQMTSQIYQKNIQNSQVVKFSASLIGTSSRSKQIQQKYFKLDTANNMIKSLKIHSKDPKVLATILFALSNLIYCYEEATNSLVNQQNILIFLDVIKENQNYSNVVESGCCLLSNLCFHNQHAKKVYFDCGVVDVVIKIFKIHLEKQYKNQTFKQILKILGNCSLLMENSQKIIALQFVKCSISFIQLVNYNEDIQLLRYIVELYSNLSSHTHNQHKLFLSIMHQHGGLDVLLTLLQTQLLNADIIAACIDSIDGMCQNKEIQTDAVNHNLIPLLNDILKSHQWNQKILMKGIRVFSNLTLDKSFIGRLLEKNFCSILANVIANRKLQKSKLHLYTIKIITRIFNSKMKPQLIIKSGYIESVLQSLKKQKELINQHLEILIYYSKQFTEVINKKTFQTIIIVLQAFLQNCVIVNKCLALCKIIEKNIQVESSIPTILKIYNNLNQNRKSFLKIQNYNLIELFNLLISLCSKSQNLKTQLREKTFVQGLVQFLKIVSVQQQILIESISVCIFIILNNYTSKVINEISKNQSQQYFQKGVQCKMYRRDCSSKKAIINIDNDYELRGFKYPNGQIKDKYRLHILNIKDCMFHYQTGSKIWELSVFSGSGGIFQKPAEPKNCCTIIGPITKCGAIIFNLEFTNQEQKQQFEKHLLNLIKIIKDNKSI